MSTLWKRWLGLLVFVAVLGTAFVLLGSWQLDRLDGRKERNASVAAHENAPVVAFADAFGRPVAEADQWQRVTVTGRFDYSHELVVRYRHLEGRKGFEVVTPLVAGDRTVLVDRGFVESSPGDAPQARPGPAGEVTVVGYVRRNEQGHSRATTPVRGEMRLINSPAIAQATGLSLVDGYLQLISVEPGQDPAYRPLGTPTLDEGPHLSYALQWFTFCGIALLGPVVFIRGDLRDRRRERAAAEKTPPATGVPPQEAAPPSVQ